MPKDRDGHVEALRRTTAGFLRPHPLHRLNRGGGRQANCALWRTVITRMATDLVICAYVQRRTKDGLTRKKIMRCLKRYVARDVCDLLARPQDFELAT